MRQQRFGEAAQSAVAVTKPDASAPRERGQAGGALPLRTLATAARRPARDSCNQPPPACRSIPPMMSLSPSGAVAGAAGRAWNSSRLAISASA